MKESKTMHGELIHQAAKINLLFTHLSHGGRRNIQDNNRKGEKIKMFKLCISTLS